MCKSSIVKSSWLMLCIFGFVSNTLGQISESAHNFSTETWNPSGEICILCHTPHNANTTVLDAPLWNHEITTAVYTPYSSPTMDVPVPQPSSNSKLCLSCHDGTVALDSFGGNAGLILMSGDSNLTNDLSNDHPISIDWLHQTETGLCTECHDIHGPGRPKLPFFDGKVECATCHDVHNGTGNVRLLRRPLAGSEICFHCHGK